MASDTSVLNADSVEIWYDFDSSTKTASVTYKGNSYNDYSGDYSGEVVIPSTVTYEGEEYSVTSIGDYAFSGCDALTSITSKNTTPPTIGGSYTFYDVDKSIPVYVAKSSVEAYKSAGYWKEFANIQAIEDTPISDIQTSDVKVRLIGNEIVVDGADEYTVFSITGQNLGKVTSVKRGIYIVVVNDKSYKVIAK